MEDTIRTSGKFNNMEDNLLNRTLAEQIDDHMMSIYHLVKAAYPDMIGYDVVSYEQSDGGDTHIVTKFRMFPKEEE